MRRCDVLVVGGGPAGSTAAWVLRRAGARVIVMDKARFPRDKVCAGWITPEVLGALQLSPAEYRSAGLVLQDVRAFRTGIVGESLRETQYDDVVSYAVRRCEFDQFLLRRARVPVIEEAPLRTLCRTSGTWIANDDVQSPMIVGAGGHFCPVSRHINRPTRDHLLVAREIEMPIADDDACSVRADVPELFFSHDLEGYGWCVRKEGYLNIGFGRRGSKGFDHHVRDFASMLEASGAVPPRAVDWRHWRGHAYLIAGSSRAVIDEGVLLVGDAAGLAYAESGEGIGPAVRSAIVAAETIVAAGERARPSDLGGYAAWVQSQSASGGITARLSSVVPALIRRAILRRRFGARMAIDRYFLRPPSAGGTAIPALARA